MNLPSYFDFGDIQAIQSSDKNSRSADLSICINGFGVDGKLSLGIIIIQFGIIISLIILMIFLLKKYKTKNQRRRIYRNPNESVL
jgi:hypothetical protein